MNRIKLETTRIFDFICWSQLVTKVAFGNYVVQFINTYSIGKNTTKVDGHVVSFSIQIIGNHLKFFTYGTLEGQLHAVKKKQHETIFEENYTKETKLWRIYKAHQHWRPW